MTLSDERRRLLLLGILPSLVALVVAAGLWLLVHGNAAARDDYADGKYADARATFEGARDLGVVEPWVAPFNAGTAAYRAQQLDDAVVLLEQALEDVPGDRACDVRINLALTHEAIADDEAKKGGRAARQVALRDARAAISGTGCSEAIEKRLEEKIKDAASTAGGGKSEEEKLDEVEKKNREAEKVEDIELEPKSEPSRQIQW